MASNNAVIHLTDQESKLKHFLLDGASYIGTQEKCSPPQLRITGGWVRDKLLGVTSHDIDIGIDNMTGFRFGTLLKEYSQQPESKSLHKLDALGTIAKIDANPEKSKHLETVTTRIMGFDIDLVNLRKETYSEDSRNPTMEFGTPKEDALRRDATVNALFYNLQNSTVEDFTGRGLADMEARVIKTPLSPLETFTDDPLRVLRCIRFASRLDYQIAEEDKAAITEASIKTALRMKISRERVGVEITKMLKDSNVYRALTLIDELNLYNTIFTNSGDESCQVVPTEHWSDAYECLSAITKADTNGDSPLAKLKMILLRDSRETFLAWILVCLVPWARVSPKNPVKADSKKSPSPAYLAAREGIKADNKVCKVLESAVDHLQGVIDLRRSISQEKDITDRKVHGQAIRAWGSDWRSVVIFALLREMMEADSEKEDLVKSYAHWMSGLESLDLLNVDKLVPLVRGDHLREALGGIKGGPWLKPALDIAMEWQLRNPQESDRSGAVEAVSGFNLDFLSTI